MIMKHEYKQGGRIQVSLTKKPEVEEAVGQRCSNPSEGNELAKRIIKYNG
jgi:hypothetical protein